MIYHNPIEMCLLTRKLNTNHKKFTICSLSYNMIYRNYLSITPLLEYCFKEKDIWKKYIII